MKAKELSIGQLFRIEKSPHSYRRIRWLGRMTYHNVGPQRILALEDDNNAILFKLDDEVIAIREYTLQPGN